MEAVPSGDPASPRDVDQLVAVRMARQQVLSRREPFQLWAIVDEAVLRRLIGGPAVMQAQLQRMLDAARMDNVTLQVLPFAAGAHGGIDGSFTILEFPEWGDLDVVLLENLTSGLYLEQAEDARRHNVVFDHLRASALPAADSAALIMQVVIELETQAREVRS